MNEVKAVSTSNHKHRPKETVETAAERRERRARQMRQLRLAAIADDQPIGSLSNTALLLSGLSTGESDPLLGILSALHFELQAILAFISGGTDSEILGLFLMLERRVEVAVEIRDRELSAEKHG